MTDSVTHTKLKQAYPLVLIVALSAAIKWLLLAMQVVPFNADEAIVALMARHILEGRGIPVFFYGQAYMGSLDALLAAGGFMLFGAQVWVIRAVQTALYAAVVATTYAIGLKISRNQRVGLLAALLVAVPTVNVTLYTTASLGGYGEALLIGNLLIWMTLHLRDRLSEGEKAAFPTGWFGLWGLAAGLGLWANGLTLIYSAPAGLYLLWRMAPKTRLAGTAIIGAGLVVGASPWLVYAVVNGPASLLGELLGGAVSVEGGTWLQRTGNHLVNLLLLGGSAAFGLRPPWEVRWLGLPLIPFVLGLWLLILGGAARKALRDTHMKEGYRLLWGVALTLTAGFVFTSFGVDPSGRYFVPLAIPFSLFAAEWILAREKRLLQFAAAGLILGYHLTGTAQCALKMPPGLTTQFYAPTAVDQRDLPELVRFLQENGETRGYSNYWVSYPLAFVSEEELIFAPRLPYHLDLRYTDRDDRYPPYDQLVAQSSRKAYITTNNPALDERIRAGLAAFAVTWEEEQIGDFRVYYRLSKPVTPQELGLGETTP